MKIYLAPMEGITTYIYRDTFQRYYGGVDKYFTPFLVGSRLSKKEIGEILPKHNRGVALVPQVLTNRADVFLELAEQIADYGYTEINLNLGCPSGTVVAKRRGAGFLDEPSELDRFLDEIYEKCPMDISVKTRLGISSLEEWGPILSVYDKYPISELIIHTRLQQEFYKGETHPEAFWQAYDRLQVPLCYNGDITDAESLARIARGSSMPDLSDMSAGSAPSDAHTIAAPQTSRTFPNSVMLGRGILSNPDLAHILKNGSSAETKNLKKFAAFHDELLERYTAYMSGEQPVLFRMKELWTYMRRYLNLSDRQVKQIHKAKRLTDYKLVVRSLLPY